MRAVPKVAIPRRGVLAAVASGWACRARAGEPVLVGGTGTAIALIRHLAAAHAARTGDVLRIVPSLGSAGGLRALAAGRLDLALVLRDAAPDQGGLNHHRLGRTPIVLATHPATRTARLTAAQAGRLLSGEDRAWPDGAPVRLVLRPPAEREWRVLRDGPPELAGAAEGLARGRGAMIANTAQDNAQALGAIEGSLGLIPLGQVFAEGLDLRIIGLDGVVPSLVGLRAGAWAFGVAVDVVAPAEPRPEVRAFLGFLASRDAAAIIEGFGYDPAQQAS